MGDFSRTKHRFWAHNYSYAAPVNTNTKQPPQPLHYKRSCNKKHRMFYTYSPKRTMIIAQQLYEQGFISLICEQIVSTYSKEFIDERQKKSSGDKWGE